MRWPPAAETAEALNAHAPALKLRVLDSSAPDFDAQLEALIRVRSRAGPGDRRSRGGDPRRRSSARRRRRARVHGALRRLHASQMSRPRDRPRRDAPRARCTAGGTARRAGDRGRAHSRLPRAPEDGRLQLSRRRRHRARAARDAARPRRHLRAGRQGGVSVVGADERDSGASGRRRARSSWSCRRPTACAIRWCSPPRIWPASTACSRSAARRRSPRWPTAPQTIPAVDKIFGPGNAYVAAAKRRVFGTVGIDMIAGPSEIPGHRRRHRPIPTGSRWTCSRRPSTTRWRRRSCCRRTARLIERVADSAQRWFAQMPRARDHRRVARAPRRADPDARPGRGVRDRQPHRARAPGARRRRSGALLPQLRHAGAIFLGHYTSEALGDYCAGPEPRAADRAHGALLVAARRLRFPEAHERAADCAGTAQALGPVAATLARRRRLAAHARSARSVTARRPSRAERADERRRQPPQGANSAPAGAAQRRSRKRGRSCKRCRAASRRSMRAGRSRGAKRAARVHRGDGAGRRARDVPLPGRARRRLGQARRDGEPVRAARGAARRARPAARTRSPINRYPDGDARRRQGRACGRRSRCPPTSALMLGNGSDELIQILTDGGRGAGRASCWRRSRLRDVPAATRVIAHARFVGVPLARGFRARRRRDAGGDRARAAGARVARLSEQPDRQPVRRCRRRAHRPRGAGRSS